MHCALFLPLLSIRSHAWNIHMRGKPIFFPVILLPTGCYLFYSVFFVSGCVIPNRWKLVWNIDEQRSDAMLWTNYDEKWIGGDGTNARYCPVDWFFCYIRANVDSRNCICVVYIRGNSSLFRLLLMQRVETINLAMWIYFAISHFLSGHPSNSFGIKRSVRPYVCILYVFLYVLLVNTIN